MIVKPETAVTWTLLCPGVRILKILLGVWPLTEFALLALLAVVALGTVPSVLRLMLAPVKEPLATFTPVTAALAILAPLIALLLIFASVTALFLIFAVVIAFFLIWLEPTLFLASFVAAKAVAPPRRRKTAIVDITLA